jgi:hypothetical protein
MAHVDGRADCALAGIEIGPDCIEDGIFITMIMTGVANTGGKLWLRGVSASALALKMLRRPTWPLVIPLA